MSLDSNLCAVLSAGLTNGRSSLTINGVPFSSPCKVRLSRGQLGIGLRPLIPIALFLLIVSLFVPTHGTNAKARRPRPHYFGWVITITAFTMGMMIVTGIQLHSLINSENILGGDKIDQPPKKVTIDNPYYNASRKVGICPRTMPTKRLMWSYHHSSRSTAASCSSYTVSPSSSTGRSTFWICGWHARARIDPKSN